MELRFDVENVKCGGCAHTIQRALLNDPRISRATVSASEGVVTIEAPANLRGEVSVALARLGYPEKNSVEGLRAAAAVAKSFVSCAVGRLRG